MEEIEVKTSNSFKISIPNGCDLNTVNRVVIRGREFLPIVRCKDCIHRDPEDHKCDCGSLERQGCPFPVRDDWFCADGEK